MKLFFTLLFALIIHSQDLIKMNNEAEIENLITYQELLTLDGGDDGYYNSITVKVYKEQYFVLDKGNFILHIYDNKGNEKFSFGKEGNGPGEFSQFENLLLVAKNRILMTKWDKVSIYNFKGEHIKDIKVQSYSYNISDLNESLVFEPKIGKNVNAYVYDFNGTKLKETEKKEIEEGEKEVFILDDIKAMSKMWLKPSDWKKWDNYILRNSNLDYRIDIGDENGNVLKSIYRSFDRVKLVLDEDWKFVSVGDAKKDKEINAKYRVEYEKSKNGFESDIIKLLGFFKDYLLVQISHSDKDHAYFDIITIDGKFKSQLKIPIPLGVEKVRYFDLSSNKLIAHYKNDDIGPFAKIYKLSFK